MKYDIFISYRRDGGYDTAKHLNDLADYFLKDYSDSSPASSQDKE